MGKVNYICVTKKIEEKSEDSKFIVLPFYKNGEPLKDGKKWGMTLLSAGSMRFRWNEKNLLREKTLKSIAEEYKMDPRTVKKKAQKALEELYRQIQQ